jgi:hypothetical protein
MGISCRESRFQNPVGFETDFRKSGLKPASLNPGKPFQKPDF